MRGITPPRQGSARAGARRHAGHLVKIELEVEGLGRLTINVRDDLKRTWKRETRLQRQEQGFDTPTPQVSGKYA